jgi:hypothetical protein
MIDPGWTMDDRPETKDEALRNRLAINSPKLTGQVYGMVREKKRARRLGFPMAFETVLAPTN